VNLFQLLPYVGMACVYVVLFGDDAPAWLWLQTELALYLRLGLLKVASGGDSAESRGGAAPGCSGERLRCGTPARPRTQPTCSP